MAMQKPDSLVEVEKRVWKLVVEGSQSRDYNMQQEAEKMLEDIMPIVTMLNSNDLEWFESKSETIHIPNINSSMCFRTYIAH